MNLRIVVKPFKFQGINFIPYEKIDIGSIKYGFIIWYDRQMLLSNYCRLGTLSDLKILYDNTKHK